MSGLAGLYFPGGDLEPECRLSWGSTVFYRWPPVLSQTRTPRFHIGKHCGGRQVGSNGAWSTYSRSDPCPFVLITLAGTVSQGHVFLQGCWLLLQEEETGLLSLQTPCLRHFL